MKKPTFQYKNILTGFIPCLFAGLFIFAAFMCVGFFNNALYVAAAGASAYIVFLLPDSRPARIQNVLGGYAFGSLWGILGSLTHQWLYVNQNGTVQIAICAFAVFLTAVCMKGFALDHPPAVAMTISVTMVASPVLMALAALLTALALSVSKYFLLWIMKQMENQPYQNIQNPYSQMIGKHEENSVMKPEQAGIGTEQKPMY